MKSWASLLLQVKRLYLSLGLSKWMSRPTAMPAALPELPTGCRWTFREFARRIPPSAPSGQPPRERGRPARILSLGLSLSFPAMAHPSTVPVGTAWARPKQSPGVFAGRSGSRRWARLCQCCAGGTPALPGGLPPMTPGYQGHDIADTFGRRWSLKVVHPHSCSFVSIGGSSSKSIGSFFLV